MISPELDELSCNLIGEALDVLAAGDLLGVVASVLDGQGNRVTCAFEDDGEDVCLEAAHKWVKDLATGARTEPQLGAPMCYAICYSGAVDTGDGFADALMCEFGDKDPGPDYSAFLLVQGTGESFSWSDPAPAGELPSLL